MILSAADHPRFGPVVERVHRNRLDYLRGLFAAAGVSAAAARARITYAAYLGHLQLSVAGGVQTDPDARRAFVDEIVATLGTSERSD